MNFSKHSLNTAGDGYWSSEAKLVQLTHIDVPRISNEKDFGELKVYFDTNSWDIAEDGLIYTDSLFETALQNLLGASGFNASDVSYSEQGMQGDNYVSFDVGPKFIASWEKLNG